MTGNSPTLQILGSVPHLGSRLSVHWGYVLALLVGIILVHLPLVLGSMWFYRQNAAERLLDVRTATFQNGPLSTTQDRVVSFCKEGVENARVIPRGGSTYLLYPGSSPSKRPQER